MKKLNAVTGILFNEQREVLIALRPMTVTEPGVWEFPGGKVEINETLEEALIREFQEEVGVKVSQVKPFLKVEHRNEARHLILNSFLITEFQNIPTGCEGQEIRFVSTDTLNQYVFPKANREIVKAVLHATFGNTLK
ncbi:MAG: hypothetical protein A3F12_03960 [Gammaproteobacteria bacterium RIFCSPHIGHO2_12_FULL_38_14]|nr:MAG: hypothetical protein A3F12_03960 [Gammaproteobacteria bacterium RIFCSPHIGHO2_12_FULL_38_14]